MSRPLSKRALGEIIFLTLVAPAGQGVGHVRIVLGYVFAIRAVGMCPLAFVGPVCGVACEGGVPGKGGGVVLRAVGVGAVEDGGFEVFI